MRIGTMVAANSGRPGGACGQANGSVTNLHAGHSTQEEDVVSNWLITAVHNRYHIRYRHKIQSKDTVLTTQGRQPGACLETTWGVSSGKAATALSNKGARWCRHHLAPLFERLALGAQHAFLGWWVCSRLITAVHH
jgi:hypothetical protein